MQRNTDSVTSPARMMGQQPVTILARGQRMYYEAVPRASPTWLLSTTYNQVADRGRPDTPLEVDYIPGNVTFFSTMSQRDARLLVLGTFSIGVAPAQDAAQADGVFITVHNPITTNVVNRVKAKTNKFLQQLDKRGLVIVYDFNPDHHPSSTSDYGPCHDLASFLLDLHSITTVAFVHNETTGHTVLPVLACKDIVMSSEAKLGDALREQTKTLEKDQQLFYALVAERGRFPRSRKWPIATWKSSRGHGARGVLHRPPPAGGRGKQGSSTSPTRGRTGFRKRWLYSTLQAQKFSLCTLRDAETGRGLPLAGALRESGRPHADCVPNRRQRDRERPCVNH